MNINDFVYKGKYEKLEKDFEQEQKAHNKLIDATIKLTEKNKELQNENNILKASQKIKENKKTDKGQCLANIAFLDGMQTTIDILKKCGAWDAVLNGLNDSKD